MIHVVAVVPSCSALPTNPVPAVLARHAGAIHPTPTVGHLDEPYGASRVICTFASVCAAASTALIATQLSFHRVGPAVSLGLRAHFSLGSYASVGNAVQHCALTHTPLPVHGTRSLVTLSNDLRVEPGIHTLATDMHEISRVFGTGRPVGGILTSAPV